VSASFAAKVEGKPPEYKRREPEGCNNSIDRKSSRIGVVQAGLARPLELAVAAWLSFIPRDR